LRSVGFPRLKLYAFCSLNRSGTGAAEAGLSCTAGVVASAPLSSTLALAGAATFSPCRNFLESSSGRPSEAL